MERTIRALQTILLAVALTPSAVSLADAQQGTPLEERARTAEGVVVGRVASVRSVWRDNEFGDRLIVSIVRIAVEEVLKGQALQAADVEIEGGSIDGLTLRVSDMQPPAPGDRAVFYLRRNSRGTFVPHRRGHGLLKLDRANRVRGTNVTLQDIRRHAAAARRGNPGRQR